MTKLKREDVELGMPCYTGAVSVPTVEGMMASYDLWIRVHWEVGSCNISLSRNAIAERFLKGTAKALLFIDSDIAFTREDMVRILESDQLVTAGFYPIRGPVKSLSFAIKEGVELPKEPGVVEVKTAATGFMLIRREAFDQIREKLGDQWYEEWGARRYDYFPSRRFGTWYPTDDFGFCLLCQRAGIPIHVDFRISLGHKEWHIKRATIEPPKEEPSRIIKP